MNADKRGSRQGVLIVFSDPRHPRLSAASSILGRSGLLFAGEDEAVAEVLEVVRKRSAGAVAEGEDLVARKRLCHAGGTVVLDDGVGEQREQLDPRVRPPPAEQVAGDDAPAGDV